MKSKKVNPRNRPASQADVERAKNAATSEAISLSIALFLDEYGIEIS